MEITVIDALAYVFTFSIFIAVISAIFSAQYQSTGVFNLAIPGYAVLGGVLNYAMIRRFLVYPYYAIPVCIIIGAFIGAVQWKHLRLLQDRKLKPELILLSCLGFLIILEGLAFTLSYFLRPLFYSYLTTPDWYEYYILNIPLINIIGVIFLLLSAYEIRKIERKGIFYKAIAENTELAQIQGFNTYRFNQRLWIISGAIICITGCLIAVEFQFNINSFTFVLSPLVLAGAFLGGIKSTRMAFIGGFYVTALETLTNIVLQQYSVYYSEYSYLIPIAILSLTLFYKSHKRQLQ
ncbi:hypothetical protein E2P71_01560 [Candidatus Bathyarchaeota archaeon]|nr:hypothetical protein E2P71_01560 [Candidatus Bathyarchaeota archaeon]